MPLELVVGLLQYVSILEDNLLSSMKDYKISKEDIIVMNVTFFPYFSWFFLSYYNATNKYGRQNPNKSDEATWLKLILQYIEQDSQIYLA